MENTGGKMSVKTFQSVIGVFFIILGIMGILPGVNEGVFSINNRRPDIEIIFGLVELFCGAVMILGVFSFVRRATLYRASMVVLVLWIARIVFSRLVWGLPASGSLSSTLNWLLVLSVELIIASGIWILAVNYRKSR
jgi:hypothetical protein